MNQMIRSVLRPFWRILKLFLLKLGMPLEKLLTWKVKALSCLFYFFPQHAANKIIPGYVINTPTKRTIEYELSLAAQTNYFEKFLTEELNDKK